MEDLDSRPDQRDSTAGNTSALVANFDGDILGTFDDDNLDRREGVLVVDTISLHNGP